MQKINFNTEEQLINVNGVMKKVEDVTREEWEQIDCQNFNDEIGNLNLEDGVECEICKNKGLVAFIEDGYVIQKRCECWTKRIIVTRLKNCGITKELFDKYSFKNFETTDEWQKKLKDIVIDYNNQIKSGQKHWLCISGQSGCGKSHLCTATFKKFLLSNIDCEYLLWNDEFPKILALEKSTFEDNQIKYAQKIKRLQSVDVLYIDDFLKLTDNKYTNDSLSLAYKILNNRYINNKITILSTEFSKTQIEQFDVAIWGRINEKTNVGKYWVTIKNDPSRNYRAKNNKEI